MSMTTAEIKHDYRDGNTVSSINVGGVGVRLHDSGSRGALVIAVAVDVEGVRAEGLQNGDDQSVTIRAFTADGQELSVVFRGDDILEKLKAEVCYAELDVLLGDAP
jgi:hypothetical protein